MQTKPIEASGAGASPRPTRALLIMPIAPAAISSTPDNITDVAIKAVVDAKLNAALKEAIKQAIGSSSADVEAFVDGLALDYHGLLAQTVLSVIQRSVVPAMLKQPTLAGLARALEGRTQVAGAPTISSLLQLSVPLAQHPLFVADVRRGKTLEALRITNLAPGLLDKLDAGAKQLESWNDLDWDNAIKQNVLTAAQCNDLFFTTELSRLTGEQYGLVDAARHAGLGNVTDLVAWDQTRWLELIRKNPTSVPDGVTPEAYAAALTKTVQQTFLSQYFTARIADKTVAQRLPQAWTAAAPLLKSNPELLATLDATDLDWTDIDAARQPALATQLHNVTTLVATYRHLGLDEVLADTSTTVAQQTAEIGRRIDVMGRFLQSNTAEDLRYADLLGPPVTGATRRDQLDWSGVPASDLPRVRAQLLAYQRVLHLVSDHDTAAALLSAGLDSSAAIADLGYNAFRKETGLDDATAAPVYQTAMAKAAMVANSIQLTKDALSAIEQGHYFQGIDPAFVNDLKDLPGYADLFGSTTYCDCEHCHSIFSPAAYFADLMYFIDKNITKPVFGGKLEHPLRLNMRRPDLWYLPPTCDNTNTLIPHLTLVIEILESYLNRTLSIQDVPQALTADRSAIGLPYHVPLATVREYLSDWDTRLVDVYALLRAPLDAIFHETLGLADDEWTALVTAAPLDNAWIKFSSAVHTQMDAVDFERYTALSRDELGQLQATKTAGGFLIVRVPVSNDIQSEKEVVKGLTDPLLDRIGRFLRLARSTGYTLAELDELLQTPLITDAQPFSQQAITGLARFKRLATSLGLSVESLVGVLDHIPTRPMKSDAKSLADQLNVTTLAGASGFPVAFHHAHFNTSNTADATVDPRLPALLNVVGLVESDLLAVFAQCPVAFPFNAIGDCQLTTNNIALLYSYATLARVWRIAPTDLILIVNKLLTSAPGGDFRTLDLIEELQQAIALTKSLPLATTDAFSYIDSATGRVSVDAVVSVVNDLQKSGARLFGAGVVASLPGMKSDDTMRTLALLVAAGLLETVGDKYALTAAYAPNTDLGPILSPPPAAGVAAVHQALVTFHFINLLPNALAAIAGMAVDKTIVAFAFAQPGWDGAPTLGALATPVVDGVATQPADLKPLLALACDLARLAELFSALGLETADCWFIAQYPAIFGIASIQTLQIADLAAIRRYSQLRTGSTFTTTELQNLLWQYCVRANGNQPVAPASVFGGAAGLVPLFMRSLQSPEHAPLTPADAPEFVSEALVPSPLNTVEIALLADRRSLDATLLRSIFLSQQLSTSALDGIAHALELFTFCQSLGIQGPSLAKLLPRDFAGLNAAAGLLLGLLQVKYPDQTARDKNILPHTEALNVLRRDALCAFIIARADELEFRSHDDLYAYFLIDVDMGGCFETSRVVAALSSLQLYVYRCLVDLEQSKPPENLSVLSLIDADDIRQQWEWRRNYRVWEANRKVFVYPENYLEPELRDDKTPLAQDLEDALLQHKITLDAASDAYHDYLTGFSTLAQLQVAGVCYDDDRNCYWFIARSHTDPYQYFLRQYCVHTKRWDPWESIDLGISAPYVSPLIYLGRLYLFWVEINSADKTNFVDGNSIFLGIEHQVKMHYSYRGNNGKWSADQKSVLIDRIVDRAVVDQTPGILQKLNIDNFTLLGIDKTQSNQNADYFRASKTYPKVIATPGSDDETLTIHYLRQCLRSEVELKVTTVTDINNVHITSIVVSPLSDSQIDQLYIDSSATATVTATVTRTVEFLNAAAPGVQYFRRTLNLSRNEVGPLDSDPKIEGADGTQVPTPDIPPEHFYDASNGVEAIGILAVPITAPPMIDAVSLMLRKYAPQNQPAATDAMLITNTQLDGWELSQGINIRSLRDVDVLPVNSKQEDTILRHWRHQHLIWRQNTILGPRRRAMRVNTTLDSYLARVLFTGGIEQFLTLKTQTTNGEIGLLFDTKSNASELAFEVDPGDVLPFKGSFGAYYREMFFHIPFLIANQLNSQGRYEDAKYWYEKIFNPTAQAPQNDSNVKHRVWQYYEFRDVTVPTLKQLLTDSATINVYEHDPFEPFAIARLRLSAFQKAIVMKYVDNLIDWGDELFTQDTMESVNEATMLYVLASDILGPRPVSIGPCKTADENTLTYAVLGPAIAKGSEFLMFVENIHIQVGNEAVVRAVLPAVAHAFLTNGTMAMASAATADTAKQTNTFSASLRDTGLGGLRAYQTKARIPRYSATAASARTSTATGAKPSAPSTMRPNRTTPGRGARPGRPSRPGRPDIMRQYLPAFCVPPNEMLLGYWNRIQDRLFKIRNCLNINGERVTLALFQPPIDPMLLVRAKAAGLSIEDVIGQQNEALPPYRFTFLVEKARQFTGTVQSFGNALLSALEKKDGEELSLLRSTHEQNLLKLQRSIKQQQIADAQAQLAALQSQQQNAQNRVDYYNGLIQSGLNTWETVEQGFKHTGTALRNNEAQQLLLAGLLFLIPDSGSPFAMTYGGKELGASQETLGQWCASMAQFADSAGGSAGLEAGHQRRSEEWAQQLKVATEDLNQTTKQVLAAQIRLEIAQKDLDIHAMQIDQAQEIHDFLKSRFSNVELYTFLSGQLMRLYREAYQMAAQVARQAERGYQFERDSTDVFIQGDNWQSERSGLLAGERLLLQLSRMEKAYLETNTRDLEVSQSFSLLQLDPGALQALQLTGKCTFTLAETWFDLQYPGQYRRLLKSVRLTIPCVVGPYVNVGAKLRLEGSQVRREPQIDPAFLIDVPLTMTRTIATSHAQNDAGVFELNFRDERYLPFEGAGAVNSQWSLELPSQLRMFDYGSLSDVIINLSYTARYDDMLSQTVETNIVDQMKAYAQSNGLFRLVSLRHEFPDAFYQLMNPPTGQAPATSFTLESRHFPMWLSDESLHISTPVVVWPQAVKGETIDTASLALTVAGTAVGNWSSDGAGSSQGTVTISGSPIRSYAIVAGLDTIDKTKFADVLLLVRYAII